MSERKILHVADIHLDSPLQKLDAYEDAPVQQIRSASRVALERLTQLAIDQAVDLVVIAGDLYDGDWPDQNTGLFFVKQASRLVNAGIPVVLIRGNHDAANLMTSSLSLPKNPDGSEIMMDENKVDLRVFESIGVAVHGQSYARRAETSNLSLGYPAPLAGLFNLGLLHTSLTGADGHENYSPCTPQQLADKHYDYWALGHIHRRGEHTIEGAAPIVFSGNLQGRHIRETGEKGCVLLHVDPRHRVRMAFQPLDPVRWLECVIDASRLDHADALMDEYQQWLGGMLQQHEGRLLVIRVVVSGLTPLHGTIHRRIDALETELRGVSIQAGEGRVWLERFKVATRPPQAARTIDWQGPLGSIQDVLTELRSDDTRGDRLQKILEPLLKKLPAELKDDADLMALTSDEWIDQWIESSAAELFARISASESSL